MIPYVLAAIGGYLIANQPKKYAKGGIAYPDLSKMKPMVVNEEMSKIDFEKKSLDEALQNKLITEKEYDVLLKKLMGQPKTKRRIKPQNVKVDSVPELKLTFLEYDKMPSARKITSSNESFNLFLDIWDKDTLPIQESMYALFLSQNNKPKGYHFISKGSINGTVADIELISALAIKSLSKGVIIAHNHPSNNLTPSNSDINLSIKLKQALALFDINLLDSLIITPNLKYNSLYENGLL